MPKNACNKALLPLIFEKLVKRMLDGAISIQSAAGGGAMNQADPGPSSVRGLPDELHGQSFRFLHGRAMKVQGYRVPVVVKLRHGRTLSGLF